MKGIILLVVLLIIAGAWIQEIYIEDNVNLGSFEISSKNFKSITDPLPFGEYAICSMKDNDCVRMNKVNLP